MPNPIRSFLARLALKSGIVTSEDLRQVLTAGRASVAGVTVSEHTAMAVAAVMTCVGLISRVIASLPLGVYERLERGKRLVADHPLAGVLSQPNSWQTLTDFVQMLMAHLLLRGNAYAWLNWGMVGEREQLLEMIPLHPDRVQVELLDPMDGSLTGPPLRYWLIRKDGSRLQLPAAEVLHLRGLSTDGLMGRSPLTDLRDVVGVAIATQEHAGTFWAGGGLPDLALSHPKVLGDKARINLEKSWISDYGGKKNQRRVAVLEEGLTVHQLTPTAEDMQFLETRKFQRAEIAGAFFVPPHMIGDTEKSTSWGTGIEQQQIGFLTFTLLPWIRAWERRLNRDLITNPARFFVEFKLEGLLRGDANARAQFYRVMREIGAFSANDVRELENRNPIDGGDLYLQPLNLAPLGWTPGRGGKTEAEAEA